jgi:hypothetical protein
MDGVVVSIIVLLWLLKACEKGTLRLRPTANDLPTLALLSLTAVSTLSSVYPYVSVCETARLVSYILLYYAIVNNVTGRDAVHFVLVSVLVIGAVLSAYGLYEVASGSEQLFWASKKISRGLVSGTFGDAATFAGFLTLILPVGAGVALDALWHRRWGRATVYTVCTGVAFAGLIGTLNRSSWIGTTVAFLMMALMALVGFRTRREYKRGVLAACFAGACILAGIAPRPVADRFGAAFESTGWITARYEYLLSSVAMVRDRPTLGFGPGTFQYAWRRYRLPTPRSVSGDAVYAHDDYAQYGAEMGILAPLLLVWLIATHVRKGLRSFSQSGVDWVGAALTVSPVGIAVANITYFNWHIPASAMLFWMILGLAAVWYSTDRGTSGNSLDLERLRAG